MLPCLFFFALYAKIGFGSPWNLAQNLNRIQSDRLFGPTPIEIEYSIRIERLPYVISTRYWYGGGGGWAWIRVRLPWLEVRAKRQAARPGRGVGKFRESYGKIPGKFRGREGTRHRRDVCTVITDYYDCLLCCGFVGCCYIYASDTVATNTCPAYRTPSVPRVFFFFRVQFSSDVADFFF